MKVLIIGGGYVGLATGLSLVELHHDVTFLDIDKERVEELKKGRLPIFEPGMGEVLRQALLSGRVTATDQYEVAVPHQNVVFVCVGTPSNKGGDTDLSQLKAALEAMHPLLSAPSTLVIKSTVPVGTHRWVRQYLDERHLGAVSVASNPEFLRAGSALADSRAPRRIIVGTDSHQALQQVKQLYEGISAPLLVMTPEEAELVKYASNAFLAVKLSFANTLADMCESFNGDIRDVTRGMALDPRIGPHFLGAGLGFGGSCLPKDLHSLVKQLEQHNVTVDMLRATLSINQERVDRVIDKLTTSLGTLKDKRIALLGLAFKPHSDDIRNSQSLRLLEGLLQAATTVLAYDPQATSRVQRLYPSVCYTQSAIQATDGADAVVIATDWPEFNKLPWKRILGKRPGLLVMDCRNQLNGTEIVQMGGRYLGMGVPTPQ